MTQQSATVSIDGSSIENSLAQQLPELKTEIGYQNNISYFASPIFVASSMLFVVSIIVFLTMGHLIKLNKDPADILKTFGVPLIIVAAVLLVITGLEMDKLTPVIGLLGTIAGYLLGKTEKKVEDIKDKQTLKK